MTDPAPELEEIVVTGQRRSAGSMDPFPSRPMPDLQPPGMFDEISPIVDEPDPCQSPSTRREWNADAAAARALKAFLDRAVQQDGGPHLAAREYGAVLCEFSGGAVEVGPEIYEGDTILDENGVPRAVKPSVDVDFNGCPNGSVVIGMIHSHPGNGSSSLLPSQPDATWVGAINAARADVAGRIYIAALDGNDYKIQVYTQNNVQQGMAQGVNGPEVNPEGRSCSEAP